MRSRPGHDVPEELPAASVSGIRLRGGGDAEELAEPEVRLVPMGYWVVPALFVATVLGAVTVLVITVLPWLRPVHLPPDRVDALFHPALQADGRAWSEPGDLEPDRFLTRFCGGLLLRVVAPADRSVMSTGRGERPGNALTMVFPTREVAEEAYAELGAGIDGCRDRGRRWVKHDPAPQVAADVTGFRLATPVARRTAHLLVVRYANTMTLFMTSSPPDAAATADAYRDRVAAVARARAR